MYKLVTFPPQREAPLAGPVFAGEERWDSIDEALDELSAHGWEVQLPIYGSAGPPAAAGARLDGFVLVNRTTTKVADVQRQIAKLECALKERGAGADDPLYAQVAGLRAQLAAMPAAAGGESARATTPLPYGAFRSATLSTEDDFKLAEWPRPGRDDDGG